MNSNNERVYKMSFAGVYPHYIQKAEKKGRTKAEVDERLYSGLQVMMQKTYSSI